MNRTGLQREFDFLFAGYQELRLRWEVSPDDWYQPNTSNRKYFADSFVIGKDDQAAQTQNARRKQMSDHVGSPLNLDIDVLSKPSRLGEKDSLTQRRQGAKQSHV